MVPTHGSLPSEGSVNKEVIFNRGSIVCRKACILIQLFGSCLLIIALLKPIFSDTTSINDEWKLFLVGVFLTIGGVCLGRSKGFQRLFSIQSNSLTIKRTLFLRALFISSLSIIIFIKSKATDIDTYKRYFFTEGGLIEWTQVLVLLFSIYVGILIVNDLKIKNLTSNIYLIYTFIIGLLSFITLEELAWGQIIFQWQTPEGFLKLNAQGQTTFHNINFFQNILDECFLFVSLVMFLFVYFSPSILYLMKRNCKQKNRISPGILLPPSYSLTLFAGTLFISFFVANPFFPNLIINRDQEWAELLLYLGIFISLLRTYVLLESSNSNK